MSFVEGKVEGEQDNLEAADRKWEDSERIFAMTCDTSVKWVDVRDVSA